MEENATSNSSLPLTDVRLIVKSANQQFEDQIIHSIPTWTIRQLKAHLTQVYPSNPTVSEQKLIYSGRLLSDELILKDILRSYKDVETENHIFHLVYTPKISALKVPPPQVQPQEKPLQKLNQDKPMSAPTASTSSDGLRRRNVSSSPSPHPVPSTSKAALNDLRHRNVSPSPSVPVASTSKAALNEPRFRNASAASLASAAQLAAAAAAAAKAASTQQQVPNAANPFIIPQTIPGAAKDGRAEAFPRIPGYLSYPPGTPFGFPILVNNAIPAEHHAAFNDWLTKVYKHYIDHCLKMAEPILRAAPMGSFPAIDMTTLMPPPQYLPPNIIAPQVATASSGTAPMSIPTVDLDGPSTSRAAAAAAATAPRVVPVIPKPAQPQPAPAAAAPTAVPPQPAPAPAQPENVDQPQPRFPNIVQEEQENRDWLDIFYSITRLLALGVLVYVYSSPVRCLIVAIIAAGIFLYHNGFLQSLVSRNNNNNQNVNDNNAPAEPLNPNPPADAAAGDAAQNAGTGVGAGAAAAAGAGVGAAAAAGPANGATTSPNPTPSSVTPPETEQPSTSLIAFVRTFVVSFFASLLPETPAL